MEKFQSSNTFGKTVFIFNAVLVFIFGTIIGSFLNVVIVRQSLGRERRQRSLCFSCGHQLALCDLIPIISFSLLGSRCRYCQSKISWQYPLVELMTGILFVLSLFYSFSHFSGYMAIFEFISVDVICAIFAVIFVYDLRHKIINDLAVAVLCLTAIARILFFHWTDFGDQAFFLDLLSGPLAALPFFLIWFFSNGKWMGLGDAKLMFGIGWFIGWQLWFPATILGFWLGAGVVAILFLLQILGRAANVGFLKKTIIFGLKTEMPFGPFLITAALITFFFNFNVLSAVSIFFL